MQTITLSSRNQITLPRNIIKALGLAKGSRLVLTVKGNHVLISPVRKRPRKHVDEFEGWSALAAPILNELWDNPADEIWNKV